MQNMPNMQGIRTPGGKQMPGQLPGMAPGSIVNNCMGMGIGKLSIYYEVSGVLGEMGPEFYRKDRLFRRPFERSFHLLKCFNCEVNTHTHVNIIVPSFKAGLQHPMTGLTPFCCL